MDKMIDEELIEKILRVIAPHPRQLRRCGTGGLLGEQQYCYEKGYREGIAFLRKAQRMQLQVALKTKGERE